MIENQGQISKQRRDRFCTFVVKLSCTRDKLSRFKISIKL